MSLSLTSEAFADGQRIPARYTCDGEDLSPPLAWSGAPPGTRSFALFCEDPDAPAGTWHHWAAFDIPAGTTRLAEGVPRAAQVGDLRQASNDFRQPGYGGPCPPKGHGVHRYRFRLLALDLEHLPVAGRPGCRDVARAARPHALASAELVGTYSR